LRGFSRAARWQPKWCGPAKTRLDGNPVRKASTLVGPDQILTFQKAGTIRIVKILDRGQRRGPAVEASALYEDLTPPPVKDNHDVPGETAIRHPGSGRPTKKQRRALNKIRPELD